MGVLSGDGVMWFPSQGSRRMYPAQRGYDQRWRKASEQYRWRHPYCVGCAALGHRVRAVAVDHIVPHNGNRLLFWDTGNWQSICHWHHNTIKPELELRYREGKISAAELSLRSKLAIEMTREKYKPAIGADGFALNS